MRYDTVEIRRAARQVGRVADTVQDLASDDVTKMINLLPGNFVGEAADALNDELADLKSDLRSLARGLESIQSELNAYARRLELLDQEMSSFIGQK